MAYTIDDFPITTEDPQIEVDLPVGTHVLELIVEDSAGIKSLPDTVIITVEKEDVPDTTITGITPSSFFQGATVDAFIAGTGLAEATAVTIYTQSFIVKPIVTLDPVITGDITKPVITKPVVITDPVLTAPVIIKPTSPVIKPIKIVDNSITAVITSRSAEGIGVRLSLSVSSATGARTFAVTLPGGVVSSGTVTFNVVAHPTITIPTITIPTLTIPTLTIPTVTIPTLTIPTVTIPTITIPTVTHPTITIPTITIPTVTIPTVTHPTITIPTITIPTVTIPTITHPTITIPTITMPTMTIPTITKPTVVIPTVVIPPVIPDITDGPIIPNIPITPIHLATLPLTAVKGVGKAIAAKLEEAGITSISALSKATPKKVADILGYSDPARAKALIDEAAKMIK